MNQTPSEYLVGWLQRNQQRLKQPCITFLYRESGCADIAELKPISANSPTEAIAERIEKRLQLMHQTLALPNHPSEEPLSIVVWIDGTFACWDAQTGLSSIAAVPYRTSPRGSHTNHAAVPTSRGTAALSRLTLPAVTPPLVTV